MNCDGTEAELGQCPRHGNLVWGENNCHVEEGAAVRCDPASATPKVRVSPTSLTVTEQDSAGATYRVQLGKAPTGTVTVAIGGFNGTKLTVAPTSLTFTTTDWAVWQDVTVTASADSNKRSESETLTHTASGGGYGDADVASLSVTVNDDDAPEATVSPTSLCDRGRGHGGQDLLDRAGQTSPATR